MGPKVGPKSAVADHANESHEELPIVEVSSVFQGQLMIADALPMTIAEADTDEDMPALISRDTDAAVTEGPAKTVCPAVLQSPFQTIKRILKEKPKPHALYLFAGLKRKADVAHFLRAKGWDITEIDILRQSGHDLTVVRYSKMVLQNIRSNKYAALLASAPCDTFTRVMFANDWGPKPLRTMAFKRGFPWLEGDRLQKCMLANELTDFTYEAIEAQILNDPGLLLVEFPEDLGAIQHGKHQGIRPASFWQWPQYGKILKTRGVRTLGIRQSDYSTPYVKPTRILLKGNPEGSKFFEGEATFDDCGLYLGPIPKTKGLTTLAKKSKHEEFRTTGTAAWPPDLCSWAADTLDKSLVSIADGGGREKISTADQKICKGKADTFPTYNPPEGYWKGGKGPPRETYLLGKVSQYHDGAGLTSPGRWEPEQRTFPEGNRWTQLRTSLSTHLENCEVDGKKLGEQGIQRLLLKLICKPAAEVFEDSWIEGGRSIIHIWLEKQCGDYAGSRTGEEITPGQPFLLNMLYFLLREMRDADFELMRLAKTGVPLGVLQPLPRNPALFEEQVKWRLKEDMLIEPALEAENYLSLNEHLDEVESQFKEDERGGLMK